MRTTVDIDEDLMQDIREKARQYGISVKKAINIALSSGIRSIGKEHSAKPYQCATYSLGYPPKADLDHALDLYERLDAEEAARKLSLRK